MNPKRCCFDKKMAAHFIVATVATISMFAIISKQQIGKLIVHMKSNE